MNQNISISIVISIFCSIFCENMYGQNSFNNIFTNIDSISYNITTFGSFAQGSNFSEGYYLTNEKIYKYNKTSMEELTLKNNSKLDFDFRAICWGKNKMYVYDFSGVIIEYDTLNKKQISLPINTKFKGKDYSIMSINADGIFVFEDKNLLIAYVVPMGSENFNMYNAKNWYSRGVIGIFERKNDKYQLVRLVNKRSNIFLTHKYLPHLQWVRFHCNDNTIYVSQEPDYSITTSNVSTTNKTTFGQKGKYDNNSIFHTIPSMEEANERRELAYRYVSTQYLDISTDKEAQNLIRIYSPALQYNFSEDSLNMNSLACGNVDYYAEMIQNMLFQNKKQFIQIYKKVNDNWELIIDEPLPFKTNKVIGVYDNKIYFSSVPKKDNLSKIFLYSIEMKK